MINILGSWTLHHTMKSFHVTEEKVTSFVSTVKEVTSISSLMHKLISAWPILFSDFNVPITLPTPETAFKFHCSLCVGSN